MACGSWSPYRRQATSRSGRLPDPLALTEVERLRYENLETRLNLLRLRQEKLAKQWEELLAEQKELEAAIPALLRKILKSHGHPDGSIDLKNSRVIPKAETKQKPEEKNP